MPARLRTGSRIVPPAAVLLSTIATGLVTPAPAPARPSTQLAHAALADTNGDQIADGVQLGFRPRAPKLTLPAVRVAGYRLSDLRRAGATVTLRARATGARAGGAPRVRVRFEGRWVTRRLTVPVAPPVSVPASPAVPAPAPPTPTQTATPTATASATASFAPTAIATTTPTATAAATATTTATATVTATATTTAIATETATATPTGTPAPDAGWYVLEDPIDPRQQTDLGFCDRSHWLQPWRAYLDTRPASALQDALGVNLNVRPDHFIATADLLADTGFSRVRVELGWDQVDWDDPTRLRERDAIVEGVRALQARGLRPLILLNANHAAPGPTRRWNATTVAPAPAGSRVLELDAVSAQAVVPGLSGLQGSGRANDVIFTGVSGTTVQLSRPLPEALPAGDHPATTLRFEPFGRPLGTDGTPNLRFEQTLGGWLDYVGAVTRTVRDALGNQQFDVEIWNEQTFGADFLDASRYYDPLPAGLAGEGDTNRVILERTVTYLRDPAHGVSAIGIGDGFASQTPFPSGATSPLGLTAIDKHPYSGPRIEFGQTAPSRCRPLDALGRTSGSHIFDQWWLDGFTPSYVDYFPEYYLNAIQTEHLIRDLSPITTEVSGVPHGRETAPAGGTAPEVWVTETNMDPELAGLSGAVARHMQAKSVLRTLVSFVSKGVTSVDFYSAGGEQFGLIEPGFFSAGGSGGPTMEALRRLLASVRQRTIDHPRALELRSIADRGTHAQFAGDGSAGHPTLWDREAVAFFPFQVADDEFVAPAYVMTRDVAIDLPAAPFRVEIGNVDGASASASATDPMTGDAVPVTVVARTADSVTVEMPLTDSVRLLRLRDA